jgi:hypothetical protein
MVHKTDLSWTVKIKGKGATLGDVAMQSLVAMRARVGRKARRNSAFGGTG